MPIIRHRDQALIQDSYRRIVTGAEGATTCTLWDQTLPPARMLVFLPTVRPIIISLDGASRPME